ncbi:hypothetical protein R51_37760 [Bacillus safensis]|nr:hypothetical protein R51_37760 [Bacillus safensis]
MNCLPKTAWPPTSALSFIKVKLAYVNFERFRAIEASFCTVQ